MFTRPSLPALHSGCAPPAKIPPAPRFAICENVICCVLRAVKMLSKASSAFCLAIRFCCAFCVLARAVANPPLR